MAKETLRGIERAGGRRRVQRRGGGENRGIYYIFGGPLRENRLAARSVGQTRMGKGSCTPVRQKSTQHDGAIKKTKERALCAKRWKVRTTTIRSIEVYKRGVKKPGAVC